jgi:hypothetical protein
MESMDILAVRNRPQLTLYPSQEFVMYCARSRGIYSRLLLLTAFILVTLAIASTYAYPQQFSIAPTLLTDSVLDTKTTRFGTEFKAVCTPKPGVFGLYQARLIAQDAASNRSPVDWQRVELGMSPVLLFPSAANALASPAQPGIQSNIFVFYSRDMPNGFELRTVVNQTSTSGSSSTSTTTSTPVVYSVPSSAYNGGGLRFITRSGRNALDMSAAIYDRSTYSAELKYGWMGKEVFATFGIRQQRYGGLVIPAVYGADRTVIVAEQTANRIITSTMFEIGTIF